jgi:hypothetical protein
MLSFLSNSSNILSHLPTLNINLTSSCVSFEPVARRNKPKTWPVLSKSFQQYILLSIRRRSYFGRILLYRHCDESFWQFLCLGFHKPKLTDVTVFA